LGTVFGADVVVYLVVVAFGIERRIDVTKANRLVADKLPHHIKIVTVKEFVHGPRTANVALCIVVRKKKASSETDEALLIGPQKLAALLFDLVFVGGEEGGAGDEVFVAAAD
jgi:hypothetical protein